MGALQGFAALLAQEIAAKLAPVRFDFSGLWAHDLAGRGAAFAKDGARRYGARACGRPKRADSEAHGFSSLRWNSSGLSASRKLSSFAGRPAASSLTSTKSRVLVTSTSR